jgi:UDP-N-acetylglucosamine diphosphorylase/glucosamine-1-phosphate N-acetyltransferase
MNIELNDNELHLVFAPLTLTRPVGDLRMGVFTNRERWLFFLPESSVCFKTEGYLAEKFPASDQKEVVDVNASVIPNEDVVVAVCNLMENEVLIWQETWIARKGNASVVVEFRGTPPTILSKRWHLYQKNAEVLLQDFLLMTEDRNSAPLSSSNTVIGDRNMVFLEEGTQVEASILNTQEGPIYIGRDAEIMEGCIVRGPLAMNENSTLKLGTKVYGAVTVGPYCKVGGEVNNVIFQAYSNKGHDGFLGNSLIGEWCNIGADTNTSNLKNNYGLVKTYSYVTNQEEQTDVQFMGVCMGDHSKCGINTMFNTATVVGVSANVFGAGFLGKMVESFSWGDSESNEPFLFEKAIQSANNMMNRRGMMLSKKEEEILRNVRDQKYSNAY